MGPLSYVALIFVTSALVGSLEKFLVRRIPESLARLAFLPAGRRERRIPLAASFRSAVVAPSHEGTLTYRRPSGMVVDIGSLGVPEQCSRRETRIAFRLSSGYMIASRDRRWFESVGSDIVRVDIAADSDGISLRGRLFPTSALSSIISLSCLFVVLPVYFAVAICMVVVVVRIRLAQTDTSARLDDVVSELRERMSAADTIYTK